jgi:hypothetical protein
MERVRRQGKGWHHADGVILLYRLHLRPLASLMSSQKNKLQPKKRTQNHQPLNSEKFSTLARSNRNDCRWGSHLQQFCMILCFVSTQAGCQNKNSAKRLLTGSINLFFLTKRQIKWYKTPKTLLREILKSFLTRSTLLAILSFTCCNDFYPWMCSQAKKSL